MINNEFFFIRSAIFIYSITITLELPFIKKPLEVFEKKRAKNLSIYDEKMWPVGPKKLGLFLRFFVIFMHLKKHFFKKSE